MASPRPVILLVTVVALLAACLARNTTPAGESSPTAIASPDDGAPSTAALSHFSQDEVRFDYPAGWKFNPVDMVTSFYSVTGYLASTRIDTSKICTTNGNETSCNEHGYTIPPGNVVMEVANWGSPIIDPVAFFDHPDQGLRVTVGGMAAVFSMQQLATDRVILTWKIARPTAFSNWIQLDAEILGPGLDSLRTQVEALIASVHFVPPPEPISTDPAVAQTVAAKALAALKQRGAAYACFPDAAGR